MEHGLRTSSVAGKTSLRTDNESCRSHNELRAGTSSILQVRASETVRGAAADRNEPS